MQLKYDEKNTSGHGSREDPHRNGADHYGNQGDQHKDTEILLVQVEPFLNPLTKLDVDLIHFVPPFQKLAPKGLRALFILGTKENQPAP